MWFKSKLSRIFCSLVLVSTLAAVSFADTIRLKDGSLIKGRIVSFTGGNFVVEIGAGARRRQLTFTAEEVESITFDSTQSQAANTTTQTVSYPEPEQKVEPKVIPNDEPVVAKPQPARQPASSSKMQPIGFQVRVLADNTGNGWTNSGWVVRKGQRVRISGEGTVSLGKGKSAPPAGDPSLEDDQKLLKGVPTGALIAVIGDDNNDFMYIGAEREFTAERDGALFLGVNEGNLNDNSGAFNVKVEILPDN